MANYIELYVEEPKIAGAIGGRSGVYAWINESEKLVYVGESRDLNARLAQHLSSFYWLRRANSRDVFLKDLNQSNVNLMYASLKRKRSFHCMMMYYSEKPYVKERNMKMHLVDETIFMFAFVEAGYELLNGKELIREKLSLARKAVLKALERKQTGMNFLTIKKMEDFQNAWNELSKDNMRVRELEHIGIKSIGTEELLENMNRIAVCKFGDYLGQSARTILATKQYDITHNTAEIDDKKQTIDFRKRTPEDQEGICFWAYGRAETREMFQGISMDYVPGSGEQDQL